MRQFPKSRTADLIVQEWTDETLVYDLKSNKAHCLNTTAAFIWSKCNGKNSVDGIAGLVAGKFGQPVDADVVHLALRQLADNRLMTDTGLDMLPLPGRREMIKKIGLGSAIAIPVVASLVAPPAALGAASCSCTVPGDCTARPACPSTTNCNAAGICAP